MASFTLKGNPFHTVGELPAVGAVAPAFGLTANDLSVLASSAYAGKAVILNIFPSIDTPTCATSVRRFNVDAAAAGAAVVCAAMDLPFAMKRFCGAEGITGVVTASGFRSSFGNDYGVAIIDGPLTGLYARAIVVIGADGLVRHTQLVAELTHEPDYAAALAASR
jgi:thiol peroxidase